MIKIILFDIDNTLIDHTGAELKSISYIHKNYFQNQVSLEIFEKTWKQETNKNWRLFEEQKLTFKQQQAQRVIDVWNLFGEKIESKDARDIFNEYLIEYEKSWQPFTGINEILRTLSVQSGILSNGNLEQQINKLSKTKLLSYFDQKNIFTSEEIGIAKPNPELFFFVERRLGVKNHEILYVGDKLEYDIEPALKAGWHAIWIDHHNLYENCNHEKATNTEELKLSIQKYGENLLCNKQ